MAMKKESHCVHALCNQCYLNGNRSRQKRKSEDDRKKTECDHSSLQIFVDGSYFEQSYMTRLKEENNRTPSQCMKCNKWLTNKIVAV